MKKILMFFVFTCIISNVLLSQDTIRRYYDKEWKKTSNKSAAIYYRKAFKSINKMWVVNDYFISNKIQMTGTFKTKKMKVRKGDFIYYYENGNKKSEGKCISNKSHGNWQYYYDNGKLKSEGKFILGSKSGNWKYYFDDGKPKSEGNYLGGIREGKWQFYHKNGEKKSEGIFVNDKYEGIWNYYHENGKKKSKGKYLANNSEQIWEHWHENGERKAKGNYINNNRNGLWSFWSENGKLKDEETFENGILSYATTYYEDEKVRYEGRYYNGKAHGEFVYSNIEGIVTLRGKYNFGNRDGEWIRSFNEGEMKIQYDNGSVVGKSLGGIIKTE